jgi:Flp pilus assembly protein TadG
MMPMIRRPRLLLRLLKSTRGVAAVEFAFIAPIVMFLFGAMVEFGLYFAAYDATNKLASQYAMSWSDCADGPTDPCLTEGGYYADTDLMTNLSPRLTPANVTIRLFQVSVVGSSVAQIYAVPSTETLTTAETTAITTKLTDGTSSRVGVLVTVNYTHRLQFGTMFSAMMSPLLSMSATVVQLK